MGSRLLWIASRSLNTAAKLEPGFHDVPLSKGISFMGKNVNYIFAELSRRLHKYIDSRHAELGPIFKEPLGSIDAIFLSDPNAIRNVLVKQEGKYPMHLNPEPWMIYNERYNRKRGLLFMDGEEWLHHRRIMNKILLGSDLWIEEPIEAVANATLRRWSERPNLNAELYRTSLEVVSAIMLGNNHSKVGQDYEKLLVQFSDTVHKIFLYSSKMNILPAKMYSDLNLPIWRRFVDAVDQSLDLGQKMVEYSCSMESPGDGLVSRMVADGMSREMMIRILIDFIIAAGDTTSFTMQWILYELATNPSIVEELRSLSVKSDKGKRLMNNIIKETMRLYPIACFMTRILPSESNVAGYNLPAHTLIVMSVYTSSRDSANFTNPLKFIPKRWDKNDKVNSNNQDSVMCPYATLPFAVGARSCIGKKIAMIQMSKVVGKIVSNYDLKLLNKGIVEEEMQMVLKPKQSIKIAFQSI